MSLISCCGGANYFRIGEMTQILAICHRFHCLATCFFVTDCVLIDELPSVLACMTNNLFSCVSSQEEVETRIVKFVLVGVE